MSYGVALSGDGRYALFDSYASDLTATDTNGASDVFLFDRVTGTVTLVSRSTAGPTTTGNGESSARPLTAIGQFAIFAKALSADGRYVLFESGASDLTGTDGALFLFDRAAGTVTLVSRTIANPTPSAARDGLSLIWKLTTDGRHALFYTNVSDLTATDTNGTYDVFLYDRATETVTLVSRALADPGTTGNGRSDSAIMSEDGSVVVFRSYASDLVDDDFNSFSDVFLFSVGVDSSGPTITIDIPADGASYVLHASVASSYSCSDPSGVETCAGPVPSGSAINTRSVGPKTFRVRAVDTLGNRASQRHTYTVVYEFSGFFPPVDNLPAVNHVKAGQAVPVKFGLAGNQGRAIFAHGYPRSERISCGSSALVHGTQGTVTAGENSLSYRGGQYTYVWKTQKSWAHSCRQLVLKLKDGTVQRANFQFK